MRLWDLFKMARENLFRRKMRTGLTILSIVIGTVSIILMIALGIGIQDNVKQQFDDFGSLNVLQVSKGREEAKTSRFFENNAVEGLTDTDLQLLGSIEGVEAVAPTISTYANLLTPSYQANVTLVGFEPYLMETFGFKVKAGRLLQDDLHFEAIFGDKALESFRKIASDNPNAEIQRPEETEEPEDNIQISFGPPAKKEYPFEPLEERLKLSFDMQPATMAGSSGKVHTISGAGVLSEGDMMKDYNVYVSLKLLDKMLQSYNESKGVSYKTSYSEIMVKVSDMNQINAVKTQIENEGYSVFSLMSILDTITQTLGILQIALGAIGGISLLVAAIGITNTMVMAITERKKEIGVMKVIGATIVDIKRLFLLEAALIGLLGGFFGIGFCIGISKLISSPAFGNAMSGGSEGGLSFQFSIPTWLIVSGLVFTTLIGLISGYLPALKAMKSSALEAIRSD